FVRNESLEEFFVVLTFGNDYHAHKVSPARMSKSGIPCSIHARSFSCNPRTKLFRRSDASIPGPLHKRMPCGTENKAKSRAASVKPDELNINPIVPFGRRNN